MNQILSLLSRVRRNKHTSAAGVVVAICAIGEIWLPQYKAQFSATAKLAAGYGFIMAGDGQSTLPDNPAGPTK